jgi:uncharacterized protein with HEPN domain
MSRRSAERLEDVLAAIEAIRGHSARGKITDGLVFDAVRVRLIEIGQAIKDLPSELLATEPNIPWQDIARMSDRLAHRDFGTSRALVAATVTNDLPLLEAAVGRMAERLARS